MAWVNGKEKISIYNFQDAKVSLESKELRNISDLELNDPLSKNFIRYMNGKTQSDAALVYKDGHFAGTVFVNETRVFDLQQNVNFYGIPTSSEASAVHVPTPVYNRSKFFKNVKEIFVRSIFIGTY